MKTRLLYAFTVIFILTLFFMTGCEAPQSSEPSKLPTNAVNIVQKGNGWVEFELDGIKYLYHRSASGYQGYECITAIPE